MSLPALRSPPPASLPMAGRATSSPGAPAPATNAPATPAREHPGTLHAHLRQCIDARGRWFGTAALAQRVHGRLMPRFVTLVAVAVGLAALVALASTWV